MQELGTLEIMNNIDSQITVSVWINGSSIKPNDDNRLFGTKSALTVTIDGATNKLWWRTGLASNSTYDGMNGSYYIGSSYIGQWNYWTFTKNLYSGTMKMYVNGALVLSETGHTKSISGSGGSGFCLGDDGWDYSVRGALDEFRIATLERSADWIKLEYENQKSNQTLIIFGQ